MLLVLVFGGVFLVVLAGLSGYVLAQNRIEDATRAQGEAFAIAEGGLEYYRWFLAHFPNDLTNGTGGPGPYSVPIPDPEGGTSGTASLSITANQACGQTTSVDITSTGRAADDPSFPVTLVARYARPSIASYDIVTNNAIWFGSTEAINGPVHSNNGIHEDGPNNAPVTSSVATWKCPQSLGCDGVNGPPNNPTEPGVFGKGTQPQLWSYPTPQVDFAGISTNFATDKSVAQTDGIYLPQYSSGNGNGQAYHKGYHLVFNGNGTVSVYRVTSPKSVSNVYFLDYNGVVGTEYSLIGNETLYETLPIPSSCGLIFVEDNAWIEGTVPSKVTLIVANVSNPNIIPTLWIRGNIGYASASGADGFTAIAAGDVFITPDAPTNLSLNGIYVSQTGSFGRNLYLNAWNNGCNTAYEPKGAFTIHGTVVAKLSENETWDLGQSCGGKPYAGYQTTANYPDQQLATDPPAFTPAISSDYRFVSWRQVQ